MSVDTYLKGKNTSRYNPVEQDGVRILVAPALTQWATAVHVDVNRFLFWRSFDVSAAHRHQPT